MAAATLVGSTAGAPSGTPSCPDRRPKSELVVASYRITSCLGIERGLKRPDSKSKAGLDAINERDAARVCADLKLLVFCGVICKGVCLR